MGLFGLGNGVGMDLGTSSVIVYVKGKGIVLQEPSVVAIDTTTGEILKYGYEAQRMLGRTPGNIQAVRPLKDGVISKYEITLRMIRHFLKKATGNSVFSFKPNLIICVPSGISEVEERAVVDAATQAGAKRTYLIEEPVAAAIGAGIDISQPNGHMVVDIGGGTTDIAILSLGAIVNSESIKCAGNKFDEAIIRYIRHAHGVSIGEETAERIKKTIGCVWQREKPLVYQIKGRGGPSRNIVEKTPIYSTEMPMALKEPVTTILESICSVIEHTKPELIGDIVYNGIILTGGGSLLYGMDRLIANVTGIKTRIAQEPINCVAKGTGHALEFISNMGEGEINISRQQQDL